MGGTARKVHGKAGSGSSGRRPVMAAAPHMIGDAAIKDLAGLNVKIGGAYVSTIRTEERRERLPGLGLRSVLVLKQ